MNPELVIFDMDGLMFDTERVAVEAYKKAAPEFGVELHDSIFDETLGVNSKRNREIYLSHFGESFPVDKLILRESEIANEMIEEKGVPIKTGLFDLLRFLKKIKKKTAVATSTSREKACGLLKKAGVYPFFDFVICGDDISKSKPEPDIFLKAAEKAGCKPQSCMVLEDSEAGITAAYRAGMMPVMVPDLKQPSEKIKGLIYKKFNDLNEVKEFLDCENQRFLR